jgi:hypothetical protein
MENGTKKTLPFEKALKKELKVILLLGVSSTCFLCSFVCLIDHDVTLWLTNLIISAELNCIEPYIL